MKLILASASPRRRELMELFHRPFEVRSADIDESMDDAMPPCDEVGRVSLAKALATPREDDDIIIAADTIVVCDGSVLGKPRSEEDAARMLRRLSGREHQVMTGLTVLRGSTARTVTEITAVRFRSLAEDEILAYVATGEPMDKAGSYGIQGGGALFCSGITGDYYNVMGLPVCRLGLLLHQIAPDWMGDTR